MSWLVALVIMLGLVAVLRRRATSARAGTVGDEGVYTIRQGRPVRADAASEAWTSGDLQKMLGALEVDTNEIDRHFLLQGIVKACYKDRGDPPLRATCLSVGRRHLAELPEIIPALREDMGGILPRITTFQHLATVLTEDGEFEEAVMLCEQALRYGLHDGTKGGFEGRIERIRKKQQAWKSGTRG